ncbi:hypothetical protein HHX38_30090, partial [Streptomyces sp. PKU-MA01144]|nr:hypothetical protein [Streptomyces sp. PKU-MA01144]
MSDFDEQEAPLARALKRAAATGGALTAPAPPGRVAALGARRRARRAA